MASGFQTAGYECLHGRTAKDAGAGGGIEDPDLPSVHHDSPGHKIRRRHRCQKEAVVFALLDGSPRDVPFANAVGKNGGSLAFPGTRQFRARKPRLSRRVRCRVFVQDRHSQPDTSFLPVCFASVRGNSGWAPCSRTNRWIAPKCAGAWCRGSGTCASTASTTRGSRHGSTPPAPSGPAAPTAPSRHCAPCCAPRASGASWPPDAPDPCANIVLNPRRPVARHLGRAELERLGAVLDRHRTEHPRLMTFDGASMGAPGWRSFDI